MDTALFLEKYGYKILLIVSIATVAGIVLVYPAILIWRRFGPDPLIYGGTLAAIVMVIYYLIRRTSDTATTTLGRAMYLRRAKYFESRRDVESEGFSEKFERGNI